MSYEAFLDETSLVAFIGNRCVFTTRQAENL